MTPGTISITIFVIAYLLFIISQKRRSLVAIGGAALLLFTGTLSFSDAFRSVNWNVMGIFVGTLIVADIFMESRVPAYVAEIIVNRARNTTWSILLICIL